MKLFVLLLFACSFYSEKQQGTKNGVSDSIANDTLHSILLKKSSFRVLDIIYNNSDKRQIEIFKDNRFIVKLLLPSLDEYMGFSVNWIKETRDGFQISIEYGSRVYYRKDFDFVYKTNSFYLNKIRTESFDKRDLKNKVKVSYLKLSIPIKSVEIIDYM